MGRLALAHVVALEPDAELLARGHDAFLSLIPLFTEISAFSMSEEEFNRLFVTLSWTVPMFTLNSLSGAIGGATAPEQELWNQMKIAGIISPLIYSAIFVTLGTIFFKIRDVK